MKKLFHPVKYLQSKLGKAYFIGLILPFLLTSPFLFPAVSHADTVTVNVSIAASSDDVQEDILYGSSLDFFVANASIFMGSTYDGNLDENRSNDGGFRFLNVAVPKGATITAATITFYEIMYTGTSPAAAIKGIAEDNTATWSTGNKPSQRAKTTASVSWTNIPGQINASETSPSIVSIVQEIVNRSGWTSGNAMGFSIESPYGTYSADNNRILSSYDSGSNYPSLSITYSVASAPAAATPPRVMRLFEGFRIKFVSGRFIVQQK